MPSSPATPSPLPSSTAPPGAPADRLASHPRHPGRTPLPSSTPGRLATVLQDGLPPVAVYLLQRRDRRRFKLGFSGQPAQRIRTLPEYEAGELDLPASCLAWLPSRPRAAQVESAMHRLLAPFHVSPGHLGDGHSEWFHGSACALTLELLRSTPAYLSCVSTMGIVPLLDGQTAEPSADEQHGLQLEPPPPFAAARVEQDPCPQDVWSAVEDVLMRLALQCRVTVVLQAEPRVTVHGLRTRHETHLQSVRAAAVDAETYQCRQDGICRAFVRILRYDGDDLVLEFAPVKAIGRWPDGEVLRSTVWATLVRLQRHTALPRQGPR